MYLSLSIPLLLTSLHRFPRTLAYEVRHEVLCQIKKESFPLHPIVHENARLQQWQGTDLRITAAQARHYDLVAFLFESKVVNEVSVDVMSLEFLFSTGAPCEEAC